MRTKILGCLLVLVLTGCSLHPATSTPYPTPTIALAPSHTHFTPTLTEIPTATYTATPRNTPTVPSPTSTTTATCTTTGTPDKWLKNQCLEIAQTFQTEAIPGGIIALQGYGGADSYLLDLKTGNKKLLPHKSGEVPISGSVSPNGKWLAYLAYVHWTPSDSRLMIISADGKVAKTFHWKDDWRDIIGWLDNKNLLIGRIGDPLFTLIVLNPFTGDQIELLPDYPDIYTLYPFPDWGNYAVNNTVYDPTLSFVVYPSYDAIVLRNIKTSQDLTLIPKGWMYGPAPKWSPDGSQVIIASQITTTISVSDTYIRREEIFSLSKEGEVHRLTHLTNHYSMVTIGQLSWSPNGRYIAFWLYGELNLFLIDHLAVLDTVTGIVTDYCLHGSVEGSRDPKWSPDSQQLVIDFHEYYDTHHAIMVDIVKGFAVEIANDLSPMGWMWGP